MRALLAFVFAAVLLADGATAQLTLPGAAPTDDAGGPAKPARRKSHRASAGPAAALSADPAGVEGRELRQNGRGGDLQLIAGDNGALQIKKFSLLGEVVSDPTKACRIEIVSETPIPAVAKGEPDGLPRFSADISACPLTFDVVAGAVLAPAQSSACVFSEADCQASPSGLWGPAPAEFDNDPKAISKLRAVADRSIQDSLRDLEKRDKDAAASLAREESDFSAERDDICRTYAEESRFGFCASRLAQARAALLAKRVAEAGPLPAAAKSSHKRKK